MSYDVMLRFDQRHPELECRLAEAGYEVIFPRGGRDTSRFQVALHAQPLIEDSAALTEAVCDELILLRPIFTTASAAGALPSMLADFGITHNRALFVQNVTFPPKLLAVLGELGVQLNVSFYD